MKTTVEIHDELLLAAKRYAKRTGRPLRAVMEDGLRRVLVEQAVTDQYNFPDCSVGEAGGRDPLEALSWQDLRDEIYGEKRPA